MSPLHPVRSVEPPLAPERARALLSGPAPAAAERERILEKALALQGLSVEEAAALLRVGDPEGLDALAAAAARVKERVFGRRIVLFAPLYVSNRCRNDCLYCGFRRGNAAARRRSLAVEQVVEEARALEALGFHRILLVAGEDPAVSSVDYLCRAVEAVYAETGIRIVHVNAAPMEAAAFAELKAAGAGVFQCFQETYHPATYARMHPSGPKADYAYRLGVMDRAMAGGFDDVGMGVLLGLHHAEYEVLSLLAHARRLERTFGVGPHTISVPRLRPARGAVLRTPPAPVSDRMLERIVAVFRLAVPYAGIVLTTRESPELRDRLVHRGVSQISAASRTDVGGYAAGGPDHTTSQFGLQDHRSLEEVVARLLEQGLVPSLCTACYRSGRTGPAFRRAAEQGSMAGLCRANALLSLAEYLRDHAGETVRRRGMETVRRLARDLDGAPAARAVRRGLASLERGGADPHV